jgi:hypothetical protein
MTQQPDIRYNFLNGRIVKYWTPLNPNDYVIASTTLPLKDCIRYAKRGYDDFYMGRRHQYRPVYDMMKKYGKSKIRIKLLRYAVADNEYQLKKILKDTQAEYNN